MLKYEKIKLPLARPIFVTQCKLQISQLGANIGVITSISVFCFVGCSLATIIILLIILAQAQRIIQTNARTFQYFSVQYIHH